MKWMRWMCVGGCFVWLAATASAEAPAASVVPAGWSCCPPVVGGPVWTPVMPGCPAPPVAVTPANPNPNPDQNPNPNANPNPAAPSTLPGEAFAQGSEAGTQAAPSVAPALFGDLIGIQGRRVVLVPNGATLPANVQRISGNKAAIVSPLPLHASYKIAEGESPRPENRAYVTYTFYDNVDRLFPNDLAGASNLHRETLGLEQTIGDGETSIGLRLPFLQLTGNSDVEDSQVGDLSVIWKHAFFDDRRTGDLISGGLVVTVPTGQGLEIDGESTLHSTVFQPFVGYFYNFDPFYIEGFSSAAVPTDMRDVAILFNSVALGYRLYRDDACDAPIRAVLPQAELHVNTPLNHRGLTSTPVNFSDSVDFTGGVRVLFRRAEIGACVGAPVTGPKPYDLEAAANLTFHW